MRMGLGATISKRGKAPGGGGAASYFTDFTEYEVGPHPEEWVPVLYEHSNISFQWEIDSSKRLWRNEFGTAEQDGIYWNIPVVGVDNLDVEIVSLVEPSNTTSLARTGILARFAAGYSQSTTGMLSDSATNGYLFEITAGNGARIRRIINGASTTISASVSFAYTSATLYKMKFQLIGSALKGKVWLASETEPETWTVEATDSTFIGGFYGITTQRITRIHDFGLTVL